MKRILITGMSGTGKSTVIRELAARGYRAVDVDEPAWSEYRRMPVADGEPEVEWVWREDLVAELLGAEEGEALFISGCASNQVRFYPQFDRIVLLSAPEDVIVERIRTRTTNSFGKAPGELENILHNLRTVEPLLRRRADAEVNTAASLHEVVAEVLQSAGVDAR